MLGDVTSEPSPSRPAICCFLGYLFLFWFWSSISGPWLLIGGGMWELLLILPGDVLITGLVGTHGAVNGRGWRVPEEAKHCLESGMEPYIVWGLSVTPLWVSNAPQRMWNLRIILNAALSPFPKLTTCVHLFFALEHQVHKTEEQRAVSFQSVYIMVAGCLPTFGTFWDNFIYSDLVAGLATPCSYFYSIFKPNWWG